MTHRLWSCLALAACLPASAQASGVIRGVLHPSASAEAPAETDPYPGRAGSLPGNHGVPRGRAEDAVIWVERSSPAADSAAAALAMSAPMPRLAQKNQSFVPRVLPIAIGTTVDFPNFDPIFHNVFSLSPVKRFDLGKYPRGQSPRITFAKTGLVNVFCDIHSNMAAFILVLPHHVFAQPDGAGRFALPPLPHGHYVLHVWHPDLPVLERAVEVPPSGDVSVDLAY
jgi:plastocyanin